MLAFCRNSTEIQKFEEFLTRSKGFGKIPENVHQNQISFPSFFKDARPAGGGWGIPLPTLPRALAKKVNSENKHNLKK